MWSKEVPPPPDKDQGMSSVDEGSSGEECSLRIVTERRSEGGRGKRTLGRGKGRGRGRGGAEGSAEAQDDSCPKPGDVVWAKVMGFNFWPAKVKGILEG